MKEYTIENVKKFLLNAATDEGIINDFGYMLLCEDERLNGEAMCNIKDKFAQFIDNK